MKPGQGFARPKYVAPPPAPPTPATRQASYSGELGTPPKKDNNAVSEAYRRLVRQLPCYRCGIVGFTQFCHTDLGKGMGMKTDDRLGWPGCGPHGDDNGCHHYVGREMSREERRAFEAQASRDTRARIISAGLWPDKLERWPEE